MVGFCSFLLGRYLSPIGAKVWAFGYHDGISSTTILRKHAMLEMMENASFWHENRGLYTGRYTQG